MTRLRFSCPACGVHLACVPNRAGQGANCPRCRQPFVVPTQVPDRQPRYLRFALLGTGLGLVLAVIFTLLTQGLTPPPAPPEPPPQVEPTQPSPPLPPAEKQPAVQVKPPIKEAKKDPPKIDYLPVVLDRLNARRRLAGLDAVVQDEALSRGCRAHAQYLVQNLDILMGKKGNPREEESTRPGFSAVGQQVAASALIALPEPALAIDNGLARWSSRLLLLRPELGGIGVGFAQDTTGGWVTVTAPLPARDNEPVCYPADGQRDVPLAFAGGREIPGGEDRQRIAGFPVTISFPPQRKVSKVEATLTDGAGKAVAVWLSTPELPALPRGQRNTIALIAKQALQAHTTYRVQVSGDVDGTKWDKQWSFTTCSLAEGDDEAARQMLARINQLRRQAGVGEVMLDDQLSRGCQAHARYLVRNPYHPATAGLGAHDEDLTLPAASKAGQEAGRGAVIAIDDLEPLAGLEGWQATLYHRVPLLHPHLKRIGFGCARGVRLRWTTVVDVTRGRESGPWPQPVFYPADGQKDVPLSFPSSGEEPDPLPEDKDGRAGFPITATFAPDHLLKKAQATLTDAANQEIAIWFSSPEKPANPAFRKHQGTTVCLIPKDPLQPLTTYRVRLSGEANGKPWQTSWTFTSAAANQAGDKAMSQVLDRINTPRVTAGLKPVVLDDKLSQGCAAHAQYLARNGQLRLARKLLPTSEDPALPGYTPHGHETAKKADVFFNAPNPTVQFDELMGTFFRRVYLLEPSLRRVGFASVEDIGRGWIGVLDLISGRDEEGVLYPTPGQKDIPCRGLEQPADQTGPVGYLLTVSFPARAVVRQVTATLHDAADQPIACWLSTPESPRFPTSPHGHAIGLVPQRPLQPNTLYRVNVSAQVSGRPWQQSWQFSTGPY